MGTLPIALGFGAGSEARRPLGLAVVGGLMVSQLLTLYLTPVIYIYLDRLQNLSFGRRRTVAPTAEEVPVTAESLGVDTVNFPEVRDEPEPRKIAR